MSLFYETKNIYENTEEIPAIFKAAEGYMDFMSQCKTERSCVAYFQKRAEENGYVSEVVEMVVNGRAIKARR